jgi:hypothetical protein
LLNGDHGSTKKGQENNPNDLFVGGCLTDSHRQVSSDDRMTSKVRIQCGRVIMVKGPRNKNPVDRSLLLRSGAKRGRQACKQRDKLATTTCQAGCMVHANISSDTK